jgi:methionyl-tRNA formyltransferase
MNGLKTHDITLVCTDCDYTRILYHGLKNDFNISRIIIEKPADRVKLIQRRIKRLGLVTVIGQLVFQAGYIPLLRSLSKNKVRTILQTLNLDISPLPAEKVINVSSVNGEDFKNLIKDLQTDLIIVNGTRVISAGVLRLIKSPIINVHVGITPLYRGVHGAYWALANKDKNNCGVTIHAIDSGIDTGGILKQENITPTINDNFITYPYLQFYKAILLIKAVIPDCLKKTHKFLPPPEGKSHLWYHPTIWQYLKYRLRGVK